MYEEVIGKAVKRATKIKDVHIETPEIESHGDYATNVAMVIAKKEKKNPREVAEKVKSKLSKDNNLQGIVSKIEVAGPGFINFWLSEEALINNLKSVIKEAGNYGKSDSLKGKKYLLEHTSPNTIKTLHVGHVRNNILGMAVFRLLDFTGAKVNLDAINNDRGIHVMKAVWAYMKYGKGKTPKSEGEKPDHFVDKFYILGVKKAEKDPKIKVEMQELLREWEKGDKKVRDVWKKLRDWTLEGFSDTYQRLGSKHDTQWFESDFYKDGKKWVEKGLKKNVFKKLPDGAVLSQLEKYGLSDTIVLRADGTSMYHTQDLRLTELKREKYPSDLYIWDIGPEQSLYLRQLFAMCEQLGIGKRDDYMHLSYGYIFLKGGGKMSSRRGNVISADWLIDEMVAKAREIIKNSETGMGFKGKDLEEVAEAVGVGAIKYGFLKVARETDIHFDIKKSLSLEGNSGPYLQYTYARCQSVLEKAGKKEKRGRKESLENEEIVLLRSFAQFQGRTINATNNYSPNLLCNYLYNLAKKYNSFYNKHKIIGGNNENLRVDITKATQQILGNGLGLLGIQTPKRM